MCSSRWLGRNRTFSPRNDTVESIINTYALRTKLCQLKTGPNNLRKTGGALIAPELSFFGWRNFWSIDIGLGRELTKSRNMQTSGLLLAGNDITLIGSIAHRRGGMGGATVGQWGQLAPTEMRLWGQNYVFASTEIRRARSEQYTGCFTNNVTNSKRNISRNNACISTKISLYNRKIIPNNILNS